MTDQLALFLLFLYMDLAKETTPTHTHWFPGVRVMNETL